MSKIRFCTLYSGSSANAAFVEINGKCILFDAGASMRRTEQALKKLGKCFCDIEAIFITHEHSDHIGGLPMIAKYHHIPIIANEKTLNKILSNNDNIDDGLLRVMPTGSRAEKDDFSVASFASMHDGIETVGYTVTYNNTKLGILTDSGIVTDSMKSALCGCKALLLEANHDVDMLKRGPYPYSLKQRILGKNGHLSNVQCAETLEFLVQNGAEHVLLGHLSTENNTPHTAGKTVCDFLSAKGILPEKDIVVEVAPRYEISGVYEID